MRTERETRDLTAAEWVLLGVQDTGWEWDAAWEAALAEGAGAEATGLMAAAVARGAGPRAAALYAAAEAGAAVADRIGARRLAALRLPLDTVLGERHQVPQGRGEARKRGRWCPWSSRLATAAGLGAR
jgi:hypothetical protein